MSLRVDFDLAAFVCFALMRLEKERRAGSMTSVYCCRRKATISCYDCKIAMFHVGDEYSISLLL